VTASNREVAHAIAGALPVTIDDFGTDYLDLGWINLWGVDSRGVRWSLAVACESRFESPEFSWESSGDESSRAVVASLVGSQLIRVEVGDDLIDPVLYFSGEKKLSVFADTDLDPWVLRLPGLPWVLVGVHNSPRA